MRWTQPAPKCGTRVGASVSVSIFALTAQPSFVYFGALVFPVKLDLSIVEIAILSASKVHSRIGRSVSAGVRVDASLCQV